MNPEKNLIFPINFIEMDYYLIWTSIVLFF